MADLYLFASGLPHEGVNAQKEAQSFGVVPDDPNKFRLTSSFKINAANNAVAVAAAAGTLLAVKGDDAGTINLILKPQQKVRGLKLPVKYFIYRGLKKSSFTTGDGGQELIIQDSDQVSEYIKLMYEIYKKKDQDMVNIPAAATYALYGNYDEYANDTLIDTCFHTTLNYQAQLLTVKAGMTLGEFAEGERGFEIMMETPSHSLTLGWAKKRFYELDITNKNNLETKLCCEEIHDFIDPAAFYGLHADLRKGIGYRSGENAKVSSTAKGVTAIYNTILNPFYTKNRIYLDIRNENGYSYNYNKEDVIRMFKISRDAVTDATVPWSYNVSLWPLHIVNTETELPVNSFHISLAYQQDTAPVAVGMYARDITMGERKAAKKKGFLFMDNLGADDRQYTNSLRIDVLGEGTIIPATLVRLDYVRTQKCVIGSTLFGPIDIAMPWDENKAVTHSWINCAMYRYKQEEGLFTILKTGVVQEKHADAQEADNYKSLYYTYPVCCFGKGKSSRISESFNFTGGRKLIAGGFLKYFDKNKSWTKIDSVLVKEGDEKIDIIRYTPSKNFIGKWIYEDNVFFLGTARDERISLLDAVAADPAISALHHKMFVLQDDADNPYIDHANTYYKYSLQVSGLDAEGVYRVKNAAPDIVLYTMDKKIFATKAYLSSIKQDDNKICEVHFRRTSDTDYNTRNHFGFDWLRDEYITGKKLCVQANIPGSYTDEGVPKDVDTYNNDEARAMLIQDYESFKINNGPYCASWLTLYPNHAAQLESYITNENKRQVMLRLELKHAKSVQPGDFIFLKADDDNIGFELMEVDDNQRPGQADFEAQIENEGNITVNWRHAVLTTKADKKIITITCTAGLTDDRAIYVYNQNGKKVGKLNIVRNEEDNQYNIGTINFIKLDLEGKISREEPHDESPGQFKYKIEFDFKEDGNLDVIETYAINNDAGYKIDDSVNRQKKVWRNDSQISKWESFLGTSENITRNGLNQCLIRHQMNYEKSKEKSYPISVNKEIKINFSSNKIYIKRNKADEWTEIVNSPDALTVSQIVENLKGVIKQIDYKKIKDADQTTTYPILYFRNQNGLKIEEAINKVLLCSGLGTSINEKNQPENHVVNVLLFPVIYADFKSNTDIEYPGGFSYKNYVFLGGIAGNEKFVHNWTLTHEIGHSLSLHHSFSDKDDLQKRFVFSKYDIDNFMDYSKTTTENGITTTSPKKNSFFKWQFDQMLRFKRR